MENAEYVVDSRDEKFNAFTFVAVLGAFIVTAMLILVILSVFVTVCRMLLNREPEVLIAFESQKVVYRRYPKKSASMPETCPAV
ncbi:hypothetical protein QR680_016196 [Steinernema hermaphroditum]|uniref:Uncharacterized protein n=1 Tax=Steinernema hermaphroditum TaxID=289476 RepID=A0AA39HAN0_9BILA|nr:hypothetical protein QR680_016196 [Steinernema hermaphroditum]